MNDGIYMLLLGFFIYVFFGLFYHSAARPMFCDRARFRLFALRDKLRRLAVEGEIEASSFQYRYLEGLLCRLIEKCSWFSWSSLFEFLWRNNNAKLSPASLQFEAEASDSLRAIYEEAISEMTRVMLTNSPIWTLTLGMLVSFAQLFGWAWKQWIDIKTKIFLEEPLADIEPLLA
jgi:hypothetical protein